MKTFFSIFLISIFLGGIALGEEDEVDKELTRFGESISTQVQKSNAKKVAVLDFTDLQGNVVELGKFIAEQTTVNLVSGTRSFSVVDRAHLNTILTEHKLSISGLVQPENAKKLGQFSGADALILGTVALVNGTIRITAKVISTETADVMGGAKGQLPKGVDMTQLLQPAKAIATAPLESKAEVAPAVAPLPPNSKLIDSLLVKVDSLKLLSDQYTATLIASVTFKNMGTNATLGVGLWTRSNVEPETKMHNDVGEVFQLFYDNISGIPMAFSEKYLVDMKPGTSIQAVLKFYARWQGKPGNFGPYQLQSEILLGEGDRGRYDNVRKLNFVIDIPMAR